MNRSSGASRGGMSEASSPGAVVMGSCRMPKVGVGNHCGPLQEQCELLPTEPSLQLHKWVFHLVCLDRVSVAFNSWFSCLTPSSFGIRGVHCHIWLKHLFLGNKPHHACCSAFLIFHRTTMVQFVRLFPS